MTGVVDAAVVYSPGDWVAMCAGSVVVLADVGDRPELLERCWTLVERGSSLEDLVLTLTRDGLAAIGGFVLVDVGRGQRRLICRGRASAPLDSPTGSRSVPGAEVSTWRELPIDDDVTRIELLGGSGRHYPLGHGVVRAGAVTIAPVALPGIVDAPTAGGTADRPAPTIEVPRQWQPVAVSAATAEPPPRFIDDVPWSPPSDTEPTDYPLAPIGLPPSQRSGTPTTDPLM